MATRTISVAGGNWGDTATWDEGIVPTDLDDVVGRADGTSGSVTVAAAASAKTLNLATGDYNGTFTIGAFTLTVKGHVTLNATGTCPGPVGAGSLSLYVTSTLTSNGKTIACQLNITTAPATITLADDAVVTGHLTATSASNNITVTSAAKRMTCSGGITATGRLWTLTNTTLTVTGGVFTGTSSTSYGITGTGTVEFAGNITCAGIGPFLKLITVKFISGTISGGSISFGNNCTIIGAVNLPTTSFRMRTTGTLTLDSPFACGGDFNVAGCTLTMSGAQTVTLSGTISCTNALSVINPGNCTWVITAPVTIATAVSLGFQGSFTLGGGITVNGTGSLSVSAGYTLTVQTKFDAPGAYYLAPSVVSRTSGSRFTLALDPAAVVRSMFATYTDVDVTGQIIYNAFGSSSNSTGIVNKTNDEMLSTDPSTGNVLYGAAYTIDGAALVGTFTGPSSFGSIS